MSCVLCAGQNVTTVQRAKVPTLQNRDYATANEALAARHGRLDVQACSNCGYACNAAFDSALLAYDEKCNNDVPSRVFDEYYRQIAAYLRERYVPRGGVVLDIGCGKGQFLQTMIGMFSNIRGIGVDPSCRAYDGERLKLVPAEFPKFLPESAPDLVVCRHTLEHIPNPVRFIRAIGDAVPVRTPVFFEIPDAAWIVRNGAFWDWCYEHVNYFIAESAAHALMAAKIGNTTSTNGFGAQYLWMEGRTNVQIACGIAAAGPQFCQRALGLCRQRGPASRWRPPSDPAVEAGRQDDSSMGNGNARNRVRGAGGSRR